MSWFNDLESKIFSKIQYRAKPRLTTAFQSITFTTDDKSKQNPVFPTVRIHALPAAEDGDILDGDTVHSVVYTMQIDVVVNTKREAAKDVMDVILEEFKKLSFHINSTPDPTSSTDTWRAVARVQRTISFDDTI